jgi:hypothetical protein
MLVVHCDPKPGEVLVPAAAPPARRKISAVGAVRFFRCLLFSPHGGATLAPRDL